MDFNVWNVKDTLSHPSGSGAIIKSSNWNNNQTDYSSLSDSQFLFGSQFCPESSETLSAPLDIGTHLRHPKQSQQNSLDSEPSIFTKYQTKPQLFGGDTKEGGLFPLPLPVGKSKGLLEQFEEKKKRAKDKYDSETLCNFISHVRESIHRLQTSVEKSEEHLSSRSQSILDSLKTEAKTLQETVHARSDLVLEVVQDKGSMEQIILEMQKTFEARQGEFVEMKSNLKHLEALVAQQSQDFQQLCEQLGQLNASSVLADLKKFLSVSQVHEHVKDSTSQTSPALAQNLSFTIQEESVSKEPGVWQAQPLPVTWNGRVGSLRPRQFSEWGERAKSDALQKESMLSAVGPSKESKHVQDKEVQTNCEHCDITNHGSSILGHKGPGYRDLVCQGASLISLGLSNCAASIKNSCQEYQGKDVFSCDPCEQSLVTEPKGKIVGRGKKGKKQQPRKANRGRLLTRKREQTPSKTYAVNPKTQAPLSPISGSHKATLEQQKSHQQPLHLQASRSPTKPICSTLGGPSKTARAGQGRLLRLVRQPSQNSRLLSSSSQGDHQMSWFSNLNLESSESPVYKETRKTVLYDLAFDSSDNDF
ncbi:PREDICTED: coiled-coil domain-containing protein 36 [Chrysochloris asiatica]|uniref:Coiled-coil domain-containing protein 36 n=1 Tax=Chrysochloris asiatica TaxID=185453 RepID=A0A9B0U575_CHRAS|nr:PREDICTED: coiled-coil domain-containing protein 36 [Chrysochloris asiatica]